MKLKSLYGKSCGIDAHVSVAVGEEFLHQLVLTFFKTFHTEGHATERSYLVFGVAKGKMAQETLVVFVYLIVEQSLLACRLFAHGALENLHYAFHYRLVEHQCLAGHHACHVGTSEKFAALQYYSVSPGVEHIHP